MRLRAIILAAGKGTRMKSEMLKVAHKVAGKPIVNFVIETVREVGADQIYLVIGHQADLVKDITEPYRPISYVYQEEQLGTGHAVMQVGPHIEVIDEEHIIVLAGDCPLISPETLRHLLAIHQESNATATILTTKMEDPGSYGRILRGQMGTVMGIREAKDCSKKELGIKEINTGIYCFKTQELFDSLKLITNENNQHEYYLTDIIHILKNKGDVIEAYCTQDSNEAIGINTRMDLAQINRIIYDRNNKYFMQEGVTIIDPTTTFIDSTVKIGQDTIIHPFTMITGETIIGSDCKIGPSCYIKNGKIKDKTIVQPFTTTAAVPSETLTGL